LLACGFGARSYRLPIADNPNRPEAEACSQRCRARGSDFAGCLSGCPNATLNAGPCDLDDEPARVVCGEWVTDWTVEKQGSCEETTRSISRWQPGAQLVSCDEAKHVSGGWILLGILGLLLLIPLEALNHSNR
jgi:hypothetical protein